MATAFATLCDEEHFAAAARTIRDLRGIGNWAGAVLLIPRAGFHPSPAFLQLHCVEALGFPRLGASVHWEQLHLFDPKLRERFERIIFLSPGVRVLASVESLLSLPWRGNFLANDDTRGDPSVTFRKHLDAAVEAADRLEALEEAYPGILEGRFFLDRVWVHDTSLPVQTQDFLDALHKHHDLVWKDSVMALMNVVLHFGLGLWRAFPERCSVGDDGSRYLFEWHESCKPGNPSWRDFCLLMYSSSLSLQEDAERD